MEIKHILKNLLEYYENSRNVGHTTMLDEMITDQDILIITHHKDSKDSFSEKNRNKLIPLGAVKKTIGSNKPTFVDDDAVYYILQESLERIEELERENERKSGLLRHINNITHKYIF